MKRLALGVTAIFLATSLSADITVTKDIVTYTATINQIFPSYLPLGSGASATLTFSILPSDQTKYKPQVLSVYVNGQKVNETPSYQGSGNYTVNLVEGTDLVSPMTPADGYQYTVYVQADKAPSNPVTVTVWNIHSQAEADITTLATPSGLNPNRTTLGLGEHVNLFLAPQGAIPDDLIEWSVSSGYFNSTPTGNNVTLVATKEAGSSNGASAVLSATVNSSDNSSLTASQNINFTIYSPTQMTTSFAENNPCGWTQAESGNGISIGAESLFNVVVAPNNVSFTYLCFFEAYPQTQWVWPNSSSQIIQAHTVPDSTTDCTQLPSGSGQWGVAPNNVTHDDISTGAYPIQVLLQAGTTNYEDAPLVTFQLQETYQDDFGNYDSWLSNEIHTKAYRGIDQASEVSAGLQGQTLAAGGWQGPWTNTPACSPEQQ